MNSLITTDNVPFSYEKIIFFIIEILKYAIFTKIIFIIFLQHYEHKNIVKKSEYYEKRIQILEDNLEQMKKNINNQDENNIIDLMKNNNQLRELMKILENMMSIYLVEMKELKYNMEKIVQDSESYEKRIQVLENELEEMKETIHTKEENNSLNLMNNNNQLREHMKILENTMSNHHVEMKELENNLENKTSILLLGWDTIQPHTMSHRPNYYFFSAQIDSVLNKLTKPNLQEVHHYIYLYICRFKYFPHLRNNLSLSSLWSPRTVFLLDIKFGVNEINYSNFKKMDNCLLIESEKDIKNISRLQEYCREEGINLIDDISNK